MENLIDDDVNLMSLIVILMMGVNVMNNLLKAKKVF